MKQGTLSTKGCLIHGSRLDERSSYVWLAEVAVAAYLELPVPIEEAEKEDNVVDVAQQDAKQVVS